MQSHRQSPQENPKDGENVKGYDILDKAVGGRVIARLADHRPSADHPEGILRVKKVPLVEGVPSAGTRDLS